MIFAAAVFVLAGCGQGSSEPSGPSVDGRADAILQRVGIVRPASAQVVYTSYSRGIDDSARVMMVMPTGDWEKLRTAPPLNTVTPDQYDSENLFHLGGEDDDWHPRRDGGVVASQIALDSGEYLNVGYGAEHQGRVRVYLFWFQT